MKKLLIISYYFSPKQSVASNRISSFVRYLKEDFDITVITEGREINFVNKNGFKVIHVPDNSSLQFLELSEKDGYLMHYVKVAYNLILRKVKTEIYNGWKKSSLKYLVKNNYKFDIILSSSSPIDSHMIALELKKQFPNIKWIADMRDELSSNISFESSYRKKLLPLELKVLEHCDCLTSVSLPLLKQFEKLSRRKDLHFSEIRNGFDIDFDKKNDFKKEKVSLCVNSDVFTISYLGSFYGDIKPYTFFEALERFLSKNKKIKLRLSIVGNRSKLLIPISLKKYIVEKPSVSLESAYNIMKKSDALLLVHPDNGRKGVFTGKLFDYIGARRPVLAVVDTNDVAAKLLKRVGLGYVASFSSIIEIEQQINYLYIDWSNRKKLLINNDLIRKHHRRAQANRLGKEMKNLLTAE